MKVLSIGTDRSILNPHSESAQRQIAYGQHFDEYSVIVFSRGSTLQGRVNLSTGVHAYATNSRSRLLYGLDAMFLARGLPKPDVVTVQDPFETGLVGWLIARMHGAAFHVQVHTDFLNRAYAQHSMLNRLRRTIARFVIPRADRIRVVSGDLKKRIETVYAPRAPISVLPIYVDIPTMQSVSADALSGPFAKFDTRFLVVSRLEQEKNIMLALKSFAKLPHERMCLIILGEGREQHTLEKYVAAHGLSGHVFFEGHVPSLPYYALADLVLVTSKYEGYGLVIIEALAAGKPVLSTDVGIAREAGAIITSPENFADALAGWVLSGERTGKLRAYPYTSFEAYVAAYCDDLQKASQKADK